MNRTGHSRTPAASLVAVLALAAALPAAAPPEDATNDLAGAGRPAAAEGGRPSSGFLESFTRLLSPAVRDLDHGRAELQAQLAELPRPAGYPTSESVGFHSAVSPKPPTDPKWVQVDLGEARPLQAIVLVAAHAAGGAQTGAGYGFPLRFRVDISDNAAFVEFETVADHTEADFANPGENPVYIPTPGKTARFVRVTATQLWREGGYRFALGELIVLSDRRNAAAGRPVTARDSFESPPNWGRSLLTDGQSILGPPITQEPSPGDGFRSIGRRQTERWVQVDLGESRPIDEIRLHPAAPSSLPARKGYGFPPRFRVEFADDPHFEGAAIFFETVRTDFANPGDNPVVFNAGGRYARIIRVTASRPWARQGEQQVFALAELEVFSRGTNIALGAAVEASDSDETPPWGKALLVDGYTSQAKLAELGAWLSGLAERPVLEARLEALEAERARRADALLSRLALWTGLALAAAVLTVAVGSWRHRRSRHRELQRLRARIASDLHDEIGSSLGSIALISQMAQDTGLNREELARDLTTIQQIAEQSVDSMRAIVAFIRPDLDRETSLPARMREVAQRMLAGREFEFRCAEDFPADRLPLEFRFHLLLILKEALHNVLRHSGARKVVIALEAKARELHLWIRDDGRGFDEAKITPGSGLRNLRQRAERIGGHLQIRSAPDAGTEIELVAKLA
jgi:signal transduction histidine kinase